MRREDAVELAATTKTVGYYEWVDIPNGLVYQSCCDCGLSHSIMVALPDPDAVPSETLRVRFLPEPTLTEATREQERLSIPLYREVIRLREENINLRRQVDELSSRPASGSGEARNDSSENDRSAAT